MKNHTRIILIDMLAVVLIIVFYSRWHITTDTETSESAAVQSDTLGGNIIGQERVFTMRDSHGNKFIFNVPKRFEPIDRGDKSIKEYIEDNEIDDSFTNENYTLCRAWESGKDLLIFEKIDSLWSNDVTDKYIEKYDSVDAYADQDFTYFDGIANIKEETYYVAGRILLVNNYLKSDTKNYGPLYIIRIFSKDVNNAQACFSEIDKQVTDAHIQKRKVEKQNRRTARITVLLVLIFTIITFGFWKTSTPVADNKGTKDKANTKKETSPMQNNTKDQIKHQK